MNINDKTLEQVTGKLVKKTGIEAPSLVFTERVMQSVFALEPQVVKSKKIFYSWLLMVIPVLIAGGWYIAGFPEIISKIGNIIDFIVLYFNRFFAVLANSFHQLADISMSPIVLIGSITVFTLLLIETLLTRKKFGF